MLSGKLQFLITTFPDVGVILKKSLINAFSISAHAFVEVISVTTVR